jgi:triacylglycerol esterase/lipase EstA (alpha/beta hydrolase family)
MLAVAAASAAGAAVVLSLPPPQALCLALVNLLALPLTLVAISFVFARAGAKEPYAFSNARLALSAVGTEAARFTLAIIAMSRNPRERKAATQPAAAARPARPVLLIHGFLCNRAIWRPLEARLQAAGFAPVCAVNLEPLCADIDFQAKSLGPELLGLCQNSNGAPVTIVAHSMGGLVVRSFLRSAGSDMIGRIVTIAAPHHGTRLARGLRCPAARQMIPGSAWLRALEASEGGHFPVPFVSIYSQEDTLVGPARSACLRGAQMQAIRGVGHLGMLSSRAALDRVMAALRNAAVI